MALQKWQEYVDRLGRAQAKLRLAINEWRNYKRWIIKHKYENQVSAKAQEAFQFTPYYYLDEIEIRLVNIMHMEIEKKTEKL